jgi:DNA-directed RNA polymerase subunit RPC12/RpoP
MPPASTARRRSRRQTITSETLDDPTYTSASTPTSPSIGATHGNKRQRIVPLGADASQHIIDDDGDSLFGDSKSLLVEDYTTIDLTEATDVPEELKKPKVDNRTKLSGFQCVICMDDVTGLTLTHCGHLFCAQCLHSSLNIDSTRGKCPMCRSKIDMKPRETYTTKTKGYWPLELKLMTRSRQGKRKAQAMA